MRDAQKALLLVGAAETEAFRVRLPPAGVAESGKLPRCAHEPVLNGRLHSGGDS